MKKYFILTLILCFTASAAILAAQVDTVQTFSKSMNKEIPAVVITPQSYNKQNQYPVLYLLHGHGDNYSGWTKLWDDAKDMADQYNFIIVCPDGNKTSWYYDSPMDSTSRYETYVAKELVEWIDKNYTTIPSRKGRAITGLSMGGHGGLFLAFRNQDVFGACGSMSGGVDIRPFPNNWSIKKHLGEQSEHPENWEHYTVMGMLHLLRPGALEITIDCGIEDFFYDANVRLHNELNYRNIPHTFISRPGKHNWDFWRISVKYHALFFNEYFNKGDN
ncbi:MAG: alpha/beta hydrolase family protein [Dysgonamonadaceae bacterium]|nr:alpha/beta hydrolase family protein [Dysgonamonadaceae bacterium]MDD4727225.1 alpha/beta hydrolase family protein [Dysgonamonadaceae bacterium]